MRIKFNLKGASAATNQLVPSSSSSSSSAVVVAPPLGYEATVSLSSEESQSLLSAGITKQQEKAAREAEAYRLAMSPASGLFTTGFMLWMSGSTLQIFSIMMIGMAFINPIKAIGGINATFQRFETTAKKNSPSSLSSSPAADASLAINTLYPKAIFLALQLVSLGIAVYKASSMGLLPLTSADWVSYIPMRQYAEHSAMHV